MCLLTEVANWSVIRCKFIYTFIYAIISFFNYLEKKVGDLLIIYKNCRVYLIFYAEEIIW